MWHELVLHGIGGATIAEAKDRLSHTEARAWAAYMNKRGPLNLGRRLEHGFAMVALMLSHKKDARLADFLVYERPEDREADLADVISILQSARKD